MAQFASRNSDTAMDLVQEAMMKFVEKYGSRPENEWSVLFYKVLQSRIMDWHRRNTVRNRIFGWLGKGNAEEEESDPIERAADFRNPDPLEKALQSEVGAAMEKAVRALPLRQRQAFLLRAWEGLDISQTAAVMGCSEGSIKTHYSRAVSSLRMKLEGFAHE
jgi:RNA polymerase sigma-70 factor, ECF subfamily